MDLGGWNFDPSMLSSLAWSDNNTEPASNCGEKNSKEKTTESKGSSSTRSSPARLDSSSWVGNLALLTNFGELDYEGAGCSQQSKSSENDRDDGVMPQSTRIMNTEETETTGSKPQEGSVVNTHTVSEAQSINSGDQSGETSSVASKTAASNVLPSVVGPQLHPMAIQSSATCPPHSGTGGTGDSSNSTQTNPYLQLGTAGVLAGQNNQPSDFFGLHGIDSAALASLAAAFQNPSANNNNHISSLAANFIMAQTKPAETDHECANLQSNPPQHRQLAFTTPSHSHNGSSTSAPSLDCSNTQQLRHHSKQATTAKPPPFYLFDAPIELRANFMQNQRKLGLPIQHDPNSYHYGETVKGFHPQSLMNQQQMNALATNTQANQIPDAPVQLIDARHGNLRSSFSGRVKNEREQKRAQKITELIDQLRIDMEKGGCKVEIRSKFHTLSQCADYIKQLIKSTKDKEEVIGKLKSDLEVKKRKIEEEKSAQESRSDPESVTSSLTSDTNGSLRHARSKQPPTKKLKASNGNDEAAIRQQNNTTSSQNMSSIATNEDSSGGGEDRASRTSGTASGGPSAQGQSTDKTDATGVSDLTDSNRASSSNNSGSGDNSGKTESVSHEQITSTEQGQLSTSSISSDAAVASEKSSHDHHSGKHHHNHKDVVFNHHGKRQHRKRPPEEITSLEPSFGLDYEEVFTMSNVPQLIATTSGKIVTWNKCFLKATGIRRSDVERMTIFSLVRPEMLSNFFEIVAHALKPQSSKNAPSQLEGTVAEVSSDEKSSKEGSFVATMRTNYAAMTLPCIDFPAMKKRREKDPSYHANQLYVTVTLMSDEDPRKRCFHCVFTNCPGTNGALGIISSDLLASLFSSPDPPHKKSKRHHHRNQNKYRPSRLHEKMSSDETKSDKDERLDSSPRDETEDELRGVEESEGIITDRAD